MRLLAWQSNGSSWCSRNFGRIWPSLINATALFMCPDTLCLLGPYQKFNWISHLPAAMKTTNKKHVRATHSGIIDCRILIHGLNAAYIPCPQLAYHDMISKVTENALATPLVGETGKSWRFINRGYTEVVAPESHRNGRTEGTNMLTSVTWMSMKREIRLKQKQKQQTNKHKLFFESER